jgi:hypothetical protein
VDKATTYRYWYRDDWMDTMAARTTARLIGVLPGVDQALATSALARRRDDLTERFASVGVPLVDRALDAALADPGITPQYLFTALEACYYILNRQPTNAVTYLRPLWGKAQSTALHVAFGTHATKSPLSDTASLVDAARDAFEYLATLRGYPFSRITAQSHLAHHVGKATGELLSDTVVARPGNGLVGRKQGFFVRASYMGALRHKDDLDLARRYHRYVEDDGIAKMIEAWSFPSWSGDIDASDDFVVPRNPSLASTAREVVAEIGSYNDAYVWYLVSTFIPLALEELDHRFGDAIPVLRKAVEQKADETSVGELKAACTNLRRRLK